MNKSGQSKPDGPKVLLITPFSPFAAQFGGQQRSALLYQALQDVAEVDVVMVRSGTRYALQHSPEDGILSDIEWRALPLGICKYRPLAIVTRDVERTTKRRLKDYDIVVSRYLNPISKLAIPRSIPTLVDLDDIGYRYIDQAKISLQVLLGRAKAILHKFLAEQAMRRFSAFLFVSPLDRMRYAWLPGWELPNIPYDSPTTPHFGSTGTTLLFVGSLWYPPNRAGAERFLARCWPSIRAAEPDARLVLAGAAPEADRQRWSAIDGVTAPGFVEDLATTYRDATFTVAPIYFGGGTNIKIVESFAYGRACVTTKCAGQGLTDAFAVSGALVMAEEDDAYTQVCIRLLRDRELRERMARAGHRVISKHYSRDRFRRTVYEAVETLMGGSRDPKPIVH